MFYSSDIISVILKYVTKETRVNMRLLSKFYLRYELDELNVNISKKNFYKYFDLIKNVKKLTVHNGRNNLDENDFYKLTSVENIMIHNYQDKLMFNNLSKFKNLKHICIYGETTEEPVLTDDILEQIESLDAPFYENLCKNVSKMKKLKKLSGFTMKNLSGFNSFVVDVTVNTEIEKIDGYNFTVVGKSLRLKELHFQYNDMVGNCFGKFVDNVNNITSITCDKVTENDIKVLPKLTHLKLSWQTNIPPILCMTKLIELDITIAINDTTYVKQLQFLVLLKKLRVCSQVITDITPMLCLSNLSQLEHVSIDPKISVKTSSLVSKHLKFVNVDKWTRSNPGIIDLKNVKEFTFGTDHYVNLAFMKMLPKDKLEKVDLNKFDYIEFCNGKSKKENYDSYLTFVCSLKNLQNLQCRHKYVNFRTLNKNLIKLKTLTINVAGESVSINVAEYTNASITTLNLLSSENCDIILSDVPNLRTFECSEPASIIINKNTCASLRTVKMFESNNFTGCKRTIYCDDTYIVLKDNCLDYIDFM